MAAFLSLLTALLKLFPLILDAVRAIEANAPIPQAGFQKLDLIKGIIQLAWDQIEGVKLVFEEVWPRIQGMITLVVGFYNSVGIFKKS